MLNIELKYSAIISMIFIIFSSCSKTADEVIENELLNAKSEPNQLLTYCNISGPDVISTNTTYSYSVTSDINRPKYTWEITSGIATIISGINLSTVQIEIGSTCTNVSLKVNISGSEVCSETINLTCDGSGGDGTSSCKGFLVKDWGPRNMITGEPKTVCPGSKFYVSILSIPDGLSVTWVTVPDIGGGKGAYVEFTDSPNYSKYTIYAIYKCPDGSIAGTISDEVNETNKNCDWIPI
jgi:hypothetical protein